MALDQLTQRQKTVYEFIRDKIQTRGYGPTVREIGEHFDISSPNGVMCHLKALEKKGLIIRSPNKSRAIELVHDQVSRSRGLPLVGCVTAGPTRLAFEQQERIDFAQMFADDEMFVVRVDGDSMIDAQIADGDFVIVRKQPTAERGEMVIAETNEGETTLKYWYPEVNRVRLQPANASLDPIYVDNASVIGVAVGVVRNMR